jgi:hypothetical protein
MLTYASELMWRYALPPTKREGRWSSEARAGCVAGERAAEREKGFAWVPTLSHAGEGGDGRARRQGRLLPSPHAQNPLTLTLTLTPNPNDSGGW